jgi:hypothetical protein
MTIRELMESFATMDPEARVVVALFRADTTSEVFDISHVSDNGDNAHLHIEEVPHVSEP